MAERLSEAIRVAVTAQTLKQSLHYVSLDGHIKEKQVALMNNMKRDGQVKRRFFV